LLYKFHVHLEATVGYLRVHFFDNQLITFTGKSKLSFQVRINARNIMFIDVCTHFKARKYVNLAKAFTRTFTLPDFCIERSQLAVYGSPQDEVANLPPHQFK